MSTQILDTHIAEFRVSTVKLYGSIYETAIFDRDGSEVVDRYASEVTARMGHTRWVANVNVRESNR